MYDLFAQDAAPNQGVRERAILTQGLTKGTWPGELARSVAMLKSFSVKMYSMQSRIMNSNPNGQNAYGLMIGHVGGLSVFGYGTMVLNSIMKNETPPDPTNPQTVTEAIMRGGAGGYMADFLVNTVQRGGASGTAGALIGPLYADLEKAGELIGKAANADIDSKDVKELSSYLPGNNHFVLQTALKWSVADQWAEENDPGFRSKQARRFRERQGLLWEQGKLSE